MKIIHKNKDITEIVTSITWSGDYKQAARKLEFGVAVSPHDYYLPKHYIALGDMIKLLDDKDKELFQGYVFTKEKSISGTEMMITTYDGLIYLLKSKGTYNFKNMSPEQITSKVCGDFGIPIGNLISTGITLNRIFDGESIYSIIMTAYTLASKRNGKKYIPRMINGKLHVIEKGKTVTEYVLDGESNIIDSTYSESIENMVNRVKIYDENGKQIGKVENADWIKKYGILQDVYKKEKGANVNAIAKSMLQGIEKTAEIEGLGNIECITGNAVKIKEPYTGLTGLFYIDNDEHTWQDGQHTMSLGLSFKNIMDSQEGGEVPESKKTSTKKSSNKNKNDNKSGYF
jgi:hypothetical protein